MKALLISAILLSVVSVASADNTLRVVADPWAPFGGEKLPEGGISLDVITTVLSSAGYEVTTDIVPFARALEGALNGEYDIVGNLFAEAALNEELVLSNPYFETEVRFIRRVGGNAEFTSVEALQPYSIAVGEGYFYEEFFDKAHYLNKQVVTTVIQGVRMVAGGRVDLTLDSVDVLNHVIHVEEPSLEAQVEFLPKALSRQAIHFGIRKNLPGNEQVLEDFNRVLGQMRSDGSLDALLEKHRSQ